MATFPSDMEIARKAGLRPVTEVAKQIGLGQDDLVPYGPHAAKVRMSSLQRRLAEERSQGRLVLVSAITPTPAGEGKTLVSIGLAQALKRQGKRVCVALREPSLGPVLGRKGGATGGGFSQVVPMEEINLHFTGDLHAVSSAHNLIAAALDSRLHFGTAPVDSRSLTWRRVVDMNDRALRGIVLGLGSREHGLPREAGYDITAASEIMAILCLSRSYSELKEKVGNIYLGQDTAGRPYRVSDLGVAGAAAALLKHALLPNIVQTLENGVALVHGGPFANIAQGTSSILSLLLALHSSEVVVTEAGFGCDLGAEKFLDIVCPHGGLTPDAMVLVATVRALKSHGGVKRKELNKPNAAAVLSGGANLQKHIETARSFGLPVVVAVNRFTGDTQEELDAVAEVCRSSETPFSLVECWKKGGQGALDLGEKVMCAALSGERDYAPLYHWEEPPKKKIGRIARRVYGADGVTYGPAARKALKLVESLGLEKLPVCMAKTEKSLSDDPKVYGRPTDFKITVRDIVISSGAGFLVPLTGEMVRMPGLPKRPAAEGIDIDDEGNITGLF